MKIFPSLLPICALLLVSALSGQTPDTVPASAPSARPSGPRIDEPAPDFTVLGPDGKEVKLSDFRGQLVLIDVWATWCGPCVASMPHNSELAEKYAKDGFVILAVCADDTRENYDGWVKRNSAKYKFRTAFDPAGKAGWDQSVFNTRYGVSGFPTLFLVGRDGKLIGQTSGGGTGENPNVTRLLAKGGLAIDTSHLPPEPKSVPMMGAAIPASGKTAAVRVPTASFGSLKYDDEVADFTAVGVDGKDVKLSSFRGQPVLVTFWTGARAPAADIATLAGTYKDQGLAVWAINVATDRAEFDTWAKANAAALGYSVAWDPAGKAFMEAIPAMKFGVGMYPAFMVVNAGGYFRGGMIGMGAKTAAWARQSLSRADLKLTAGDEAAVKAVMDELFANRATAPAAKTMGGMLPAPAAPKGDLLGVGAVAPDFVMKDVAGRDVRLSDFKGQVVVLDFWATWCGPCIASFPHTQEIAAKYKDQGVVVLASGTSDTVAKFQEWIPRNQPKYPDLRFAYDLHERESLTFEERASSKLYGVKGIPTQFIIGRDGKITGVVVGNGGAGDARTEIALAAAGIPVDAAIVAQGKAQLAKAEQARAAAAAAEVAKPAAPFREAYGKLRAGDDIPDFTILTPEGKEAKFSDYARGKTVILDFWATWCGPCQQAMPHYEAMHRKYRDKNVVILGVCSFDTREAYLKWVAANQGKYSFATVFDPVGKPAAGDKEAMAKTVMMQLSRGAVTPLPTTLVINPAGKFTGFYAGYGEKTHDALANLLMIAGVELAPEDQPKTFFPAGYTLKPAAVPMAGAGTMPAAVIKPMEGGATTAAPKPATLAAGAVAPDFAMRDIDGKEVKLSDFKGRVVVLDFWATWCGPCIASFPHTQEIAAKYKDQGVVVLASGTSDTIAKFQEWIPKNQPKYPDLKFGFDPNERNSPTFDQRASSRLYHVTGIPTQFVIGRDGRIAATIVGNGGKEDARTEAALASVGVRVDEATVARGAKQLKQDAEEAVAAAAAAKEEEKNPKPQFREAYGKLKAGTPVPDLTLQTVAGTPAKLSQLTKGKAVVLGFWNGGNGPGDQTLALFSAWAKKYAGQGVLFLGVGGYDSREAFEQWRATNEAKIGFTVVSDPAGKPPQPPKPMDELTADEKQAYQALSRDYYGRVAALQFTGGAMAPIPNFTVIDPAGNMVGFFVGAGPQSAESLGNLLLRAGIRLAPEDMPKKIFTAAETKEAPPEPKVETLKIGAPAPDFTTQDLDGKAVKLADFKGKVVILDFWATWCGPCMAAMPHTQEVAAHYKDQGVVVLGSCTSDARAKFEAWVKANREKYPDILWSHDPAERGADRASRKLYGVTGIPTQFIIDRDGKVVDIVVGYLKGEVLLDDALRKAGITVAPEIAVRAEADRKKRNGG